MATMCSLSKKYLNNDKEIYIKYLNKPKFMCKNCGRLANDSKNLCNPTIIEVLPIKSKKKEIKKIRKLKNKIKALKKKFKKL